MNGLFTGGGTELGPALETLLDSRQKSMPTAVFILTDGEIYEVGSSAIDELVSEMFLIRQKHNVPRVSYSTIFRHFRMPPCDSLFSVLVAPYPPMYAPDLPLLETESIS